MAKLILLTGGTGNIGFQILLQALQAGYHVRAATRNDNKVDNIRSHPRIKQLKLAPEALTFVSVSDITAPQAYDEAIKGVEYAIHSATAVPTNVAEKDPAKGEELFVKPAVKGTLSILEAAQSEITVKRVVITSSAVAIVPFVEWSGQDPPEGTTFKATDRNPMRMTNFKNMVEAYIASKTAALLETENWVAKNRPRFDVVNIHPGFVIGKNELASTRAEVNSGTNSIALGPALGRTLEAVAGNIRATSCCHIDDVAEAHVVSLHKSLDGLETGQCRSFALSLPVCWDDILDIAKKDFADAVSNGTFPLKGHQPECGVNIDCSETEALLGHELQRFESQAKSILSAYMEASA